MITIIYNIIILLLIILHQFKNFLKHTPLEAIQKNVFCQIEINFQGSLEVLSIVVILSRFHQVFRLLSFLNHRWGIILTSKKKKKIK